MPRVEELDDVEFAEAVADGVQLPVPDHSDRPPRVVMFRPSGLEHDTRGKKIALSLARGGYEVFSINCVPPGTTVTEPRSAIGPVQVVTVAMRNRHRATHSMRLASRRRRYLRLLDWTGRDEYVTQVAELRRDVNDLRDQRQERPNALGLKASHVLARARLVGRRGRWKGQAMLDQATRQAWHTWDERRNGTDWLATDRGVLPELADYADTFGPVLDSLEPDVLHAHHPTVLPVALRAARRLRARGGHCIVVYDARENYAGIPAGEQGNARRHAVLVRQEARSIDQLAGVITVSEPIADELQQRYRLPQRPTVLLNVPPYVPDAATAAQGAPSLRARVGLPADAPLLVYSGGVSRARGIEVLIDALAHLPGVHLALVTVPHPHPMDDELLSRATDLGVRDQLHLVPPVGQSELIGYLASADVALHPLPGGSPNHDQAMPNKLFEYLHAGLPLVVSDAKLMAQFVREHGIGEVFRTDDAADLASAVRRVLDARAAGTAEQSDAARQGRIELAKQYSWQGQELRLLELYTRVAPLPGAVAAQDVTLPTRFPALEVGT